jgi:hypothetical protein
MRQSGVRRKMVTWVQQKDSHGCVLASLAMITGQTYEQVKAGFVDWSGGISLMFDGFTYLAEHGYAVAPKYIHYHPLKRNRDPWPVEPFADMHLCEVITSMAHSVVLLRDGTVLDPNTPEPRRLSDYMKVNVIAGVVPVSTATQPFPPHSCNN